MLRNFFLELMNKSVKQNESNILSLIEPIEENGILLDLGCDDGTWTSQVAKKLNPSKVEGVEIIEEQGKKAETKGIKIHYCNLNNTLPIENNYASVIHTNQVIEHMWDVDIFLSEIYRILKPGGYLILSTENLSSWHNIIALLMGFQPFSMTNCSNKGSIGNPMAIWKNQKSTMQETSTWLHNKLFSYFGLKDLLEKHGFKVEKIKTAGYYPLPGGFTNIDPYHGHWISCRARK